LIQYTKNEEYVFVEPQEITQVQYENDVPIGKNGQPLGQDIKLTSIEQVKQLCKIAGWFEETTRPYDTYTSEMWILRNTAEIYDLDVEEMRSLAHEVAAVCIGKYDANNVNKVYNATSNRDPNRKRQLLANLRRQAKEKDEFAYLAWLAGVKVEVPRSVAQEESVVVHVDEKKEEPPQLFCIDPNATESKLGRKLHKFVDHNVLALKEIDMKTAYKWSSEALVMVMNGGNSYFLTRNVKTCEVTNRPYERWMSIESGALLKCLNVNTFIKNPLWTPQSPETVEKHLYTKLGSGTPKAPGFMADQIANRTLTWVDREDFIPYLERRIPDESIRQAVTNKRVFNKFRGFPIESEKYNPEGPKFIGSAWHTHLMNDICHGDIEEWKHLEATMADMIQRPYRVSGVAHVFQGAQGTGKSFLHRFMSEMLGAAHTMLISDMAMYIQRFNEDQDSAILKVFEEVRGKGDQFVNNDRLKADITKLAIRVEIKGGAILSLRHCARYWMLTNHRDTLHIEADDRRYVYHAVADTHANNKVYFAPIVAEFENMAYIRACFEYFAELEYDEMFVMTAISTAYKNEQKLDSMNLHLKFLKCFIETNAIADAARVDMTRADGTKIHAHLVYEMYERWCADNHHTPSSSNAMTKSFSPIGLKQKSGRIQGKVMKVLEIDRDELRESFRKHFKMPTFDWDE
jgi:hypothetical protein